MMRIAATRFLGVALLICSEVTLAAGALKHEIEFRDSYSSFGFRSFAKLDTEIGDGADPGT